MKKEEKSCFFEQNLKYILIFADTSIGLRIKRLT